MRGYRCKRGGVKKRGSNAFVREQRFASHMMHTCCEGVAWFARSSYCGFSSGSGIYIGKRELRFGKWQQSGLENLFDRSFPSLTWGIAPLNSPPPTLSSFLFSFPCRFTENGHLNLLQGRRRRPSSFCSDLPPVAAATEGEKKRIMTLSNYKSPFLFLPFLPFPTFRFVEHGRFFPWVAAASDARFWNAPLLLRADMHFIIGPFRTSSMKQGFTV